MRTCWQTSCSNPSPSTWSSDRTIWTSKETACLVPGTTSSRPSVKVWSSSKRKTQAAEPKKNFWTSGTRKRSKTRTLAPPFAGPSWHARGGSDWTSRGCQEWPPLSEKTPDCSVMPAQQSPSPPWSWRSTWNPTLRLMARCPSSSQETRLKPHPTSRGTQRPSSQVKKSVFENKNIIGNFNKSGSESGS